MLPTTQEGATGKGIVQILILKMQPACTVMNALKIALPARMIL